MYKRWHRALYGEWGPEKTDQAAQSQAVVRGNLVTRAVCLKPTKVSYSYLLPNAHCASDICLKIMCSLPHCLSTT